MLLSDCSVCGWSSPSTRRRPASASRQYGSASASLPWPWSSKPMLLIETSVSRWSSPRTRRRPASASRQYGSASAYLPIDQSSKPVLLIETSVSGWSSPSTRRRRASARSICGMAWGPKPSSRYVSPTVCRRTASTSGWSAKSRSMVSNAGDSTWWSTTSRATFVGLTRRTKASKDASAAATSSGVIASALRDSRIRSRRSATMPPPICSASIPLSIDDWKPTTTRN